MGSTCCKDSRASTDSQMTVSGKEGSPTDDEASPPGKVKRKVAIRRTVQSEEIGLTADDVEARHGAEDPDLEKICKEAEERKAAKEAKAAERQKMGHRPSFNENKPEEIERSEGTEAPIVAKRCKGRKGTGFVKKSDAPPPEDEGEDEDQDVATPKRAKDRKGTGFVKKGMLPIDDDEEEEEDEEEEAPAPKAASKRCKNRKGTGFVKKGALPIDDDDEDE